MMTRSLLDRAQDRAQRRFRAMLEGKTYPDPLAPETRLYVQSERLVDALIVEAQWEQAKAEMDAAQDADHDYHDLSGAWLPRTCDDCAEMQEQPMLGWSPEGEARAMWGNR